MVIKSFRRGAAERLFHRGDVGRVNPAHRVRLREILEALDGPDPLRALSMPNYRLKGDRKGQWSVRVSHDWRVTFRTDDKSVWDVQYEDYHH